VFERKTRSVSLTDAGTLPQARARLVALPISAKYLEVEELFEEELL
jgi:hypothetical protein